MIDTPISDGSRQSLSSTEETGREPTVTELVSGIADDARRLFQQQYQMLRAEVREDIRRTRSAVKYMGLGAGAIAVGTLFLVIAVPLLINWAFALPAFAGWAIVGGALLVLGVIALYAGKRIFEKNNPLPDKSLRALEENLSWITNQRN
jgi:hypothetical protein